MFVLDDDSFDDDHRISVENVQTNESLDLIELGVDDVRFSFDETSD